MTLVPYWSLLNFSYLDLFQTLKASILRPLEIEVIKLMKHKHESKRVKLRQTHGKQHILYPFKYFMCK